MTMSMAPNIPPLGNITPTQLVLPLTKQLSHETTGGQTRCGQWTTQLGTVCTERLQFHCNYIIQYCLYNIANLVLKHSHFLTGLHWHLLK